MGYKPVKDQIREQDTLKYAHEVWLTLSERERQNIWDNLRW